MASGMTGLYIGASGLQAAQTSLNATAHNLSNINTTGYTRQQIKNSASTYMDIGLSATNIKQYGLGVDIQTIRRVRDELIDAAYRQENGRRGYYESQYDALLEVESLFGEMEGVTFQQTMTNLWNSLNELSKEPLSTVSRESVIETSTVFVERANSIYKSLRDYQTTLNTKILNSISKVNKLGDKIAKLNAKICQIEALGESANDYRDQRDSAIDELSTYVKTVATEDKNGMTTVTCEGIVFVSARACYGMDYEYVEGTQLVKPCWPHLGNRPVYLEREQVTAMDNNDIGELKGLLLARGGKAVNYTDVPVRPEEKDYDLSDPASAAQYQADLQTFNQKCEFYNDYIEPSVILSAMATLDKLVNGIVTSINDILCPETTASFTAADGTVYTDAVVLDMDNTGYGSDEDKSVGVELFSRDYTQRYKQVEADDGTVYYVRNNINATNNPSDYTLGNIRVNDVASEDVTKIPMATKVGEEDFERGKKLMDIWDQEFASVNPSRFSKENFMGFYVGYVDEFANVGSVLKKLVDAQETMTSGYDNQRLQTEGVSSDEELQNMIKFQQAYNAASRYINVVSEMLEHIVTRLGS